MRTPIFNIDPGKTINYHGHLCLVLEHRKEGTLPKPECFEWAVTPWSTPKADKDDCWVLGLNINGSLGYDRCSSTYGSRPAFLLPSDYTVEVKGQPAGAVQHP